MTKLGMRRTIPQLPLRRKTPLKSRKGLSRMSERAKREQKVWLDIKVKRMIALHEKFGFIPCEYCKKAVDGYSQLYTPEAHHNDGDRRNNTAKNCRILHRYCNQIVEDRNVKDVPSLL